MSGKDISTLWMQNPDSETQCTLGHYATSHINGPSAQSQRQPVAEALNSFRPLLQSPSYLFFLMESDILFLFIMPFLLKSDVNMRFEEK